MAEAAYAAGTALLGAPRLLASGFFGFSGFFSQISFPISARGRNSAPVILPFDNLLYTVGAIF
jgi:hypothetical protein